MKVQGSKGSKESEGKVDGPSGRRLWPPDGGGLCSLRSGGDSACGAEGCGLPSRAMLIKSALRDLLFCVIWHDRHSADWLAALASPYPASPDFHLKVKRLTMICALLALLHPLLSLTHWIFRSLMLPYKSSSHSAKCVRCASLPLRGRQRLRR